MKYTIVYERSPRNYGAWSPDLLGCVTTAKTLDATRRLMREAIDFHLDGLAEDGDIKPKPTGYIEILGFEPSKPRRRKKNRTAVAARARPKRKPTRKVARARK